MLETFTFFYGESKNLVAFFTHTHAFYYLFGPYAFFYVRSVLRDNSHVFKTDLLHFLPFLTSLIGFLPYFFKSWDYKLMVAENIQSDGWDMARFHLNFIIPHKADQFLNLLHVYFYSIALWVVLKKYKRDVSCRIYNVPQFKLIRNWLFIFTLIITIITINFTFAMSFMWIYDEKSIFLRQASYALFFASVVYVGMNMVVMFFPHILYGLSIEWKESKFTNPGGEISSLHPNVLNDEKLMQVLNEADSELHEKEESPLLFSAEYIQNIESAMRHVVNKQLYLLPDFKLNKMAEISNLPSHHFTYYFNTILNVPFSNWRNNLRIDYAIMLLKEGEASALTIEAIALKSGFSAQNTFNRAFKIRTHQTPSEYLRGIS